MDFFISGYYLYVSYNADSAGIPGYGATLMSPIFPPPPIYNYKNTSVYFKSCRVSGSQLFTWSLFLYSVDVFRPGRFV